MSAEELNAQQLYELVHVKKRCPQCDGEVKQLDKDTSSGRDMRLYKCDACGWCDEVDTGIALWKVYSMANKGES